METQVDLGLLDATNADAQEIDLDTLQCWDRNHEDLDVDQTVVEVRSGVVPVVDNHIEGVGCTSAKQRSGNIEL